MHLKFHRQRGLAPESQPLHSDCYNHCTAGPRIHSQGHTSKCHTTPPENTNFKNCIKIISQTHGPREVFQMKNNRETKNIQLSRSTSFGGYRLNVQYTFQNFTCVDVHSEIT